MKEVFNKVWRKNKLVTSNSPERTTTAYQPGGTTTLVVNKWVSHICGSGQDALGRWSYITLKGKQERKVTIISAYRVCENSLDQAGPTTCWKQQWRQLRKKGYSCPDPRKRFLSDFKTFLETRMANDEELIIGIDANDTDHTTTDFGRFCKQCDLVDVFTHLHPENTPPHTYQRGNNRIDYILITPALTPALKSTGFLPFNIPFMSDHGLAYADFDEEVLFLGMTNNPVDSARRNLISTNPKGRANYCDDMADQFLRHNITHRVEQLYHRIKRGRHASHDVVT